MKGITAAVGAFGIAAVALAAVLAPVWTYAVTLAVFGLPHVAVELRYVDERFGARIDPRLLLALGCGLLGIVSLRIAAFAGHGTADCRAAIEFALGAWLLAAVLPRLLARGILAAGAGTLLLLLALWVAATAPLVALVLFAVLHNLTPVGFLAERLRGSGRRVALGWCAVAFGLVPLAIATGVLSAALGVDGSMDGPPGVGPIEQHLGVFVPGRWQQRDAAPHLFAAAAFLQCAHYAVVLLVLPHLGGGAARGGAHFRWPARRQFLLAVAAAAAVLLLGHAVDFAAARSAYGIVAAVHAWIEIPVLLLAAAGVPPVAARVTEAHA